MKIPRALAPLLVVALLALAGCSSVSGDTSVSGGDGAERAGVSGGAPMEVPGVGTPMKYSADDAGAREVVTTGSLTARVEDTSAAADEIVEIVERAGGRVDGRSENAATEGRDSSAWLTLRIPADKLTATISEVEKVGEVTDLSLSSDDVTQYGRDLDARIGALEASTERLIVLMREADSSEALIAAENALSERQADLESLRSEREYLSDQVAMSTLDVALVSTPTVEFEAGGFVGGLTSGWHALVGFASGVLVALGAVLPWIVAFGIPLAVVVWVVRRRRSKARA